MTIHFSLLAVCLAGGGLLGLVVGWATAMGGWMRDWLMSLGVTIAVLGVLATAIGIGGQVFLWINTTTGH